jgi:hypothetical protein
VYYDLLANFANVVEVLSGRLLRRGVVAPTIVVFILALPFVGALWWISAVGAVALFLLFSLWLARNHLRRTNGPDAGLP